VVTTQVTPTISWTPASAIILGSPGTNVLNATVSCGTTCGGITYTATPSGGSPVGITSTSGLALGVYTITANFTPLNPSEYNATSVSSTLTVSGESVWIVDGGGGTGELAGNGAAITSSADTGETTAVAIDAGGNVWTVGSGSLDETSQVGTVQNTVSSGSGGLHLPAAIAIDGNSQVWVTNGNNSVSLFSNAGTALSPSTGFTDSSLSTPTGIAIDPGGSVWIANKGNNSVTRILGGAAPAAPLSTAAANNTIGAKP
jgi:streptogramin lyase